MSTPGHYIQEELDDGPSRKAGVTRDQGLLLRLEPEGVVPQGDALLVLKREIMRQACVMT
jgi:hypothetical protein